jgi:hypothetical protein
MQLLGGDMKTLLLPLLLIFCTGTSSAQNVVGDWNGSLKVGAAELRLILHISKNADGSLKATLDSVDQGATEIPVKAAMLQESRLKLDVEAVNGSYVGKVNGDASEIAGTWTQGPVFRAQLSPRRYRRQGPREDRPANGHRWRLGRRA